MTASRMSNCWDAVTSNYQAALDKEKGGENLNEEEKLQIKKNEKAAEHLTLALEKGAHRAIRQGKGNAFSINACLKKRFCKQAMDELITIEDKITKLEMA